MTDSKVRTLGPGQLLIGDGQDSQKFDVDCTKTSLTPKSDTDDADEFLDGHTESGAQTVSWTLDTTVKEDFSKDGIQAWCFQHSGETKPFTFVPNDKGTLAFQGDVLIAPIGIGGDVKKRNEQDVSFTATNVRLLDHTPGAKANDQPIAD